MLKGIIYLIIAHVAFLISNFVLHIFIARTLGPELYGLFGVVNSFILLNEILLFRCVFDTLSVFVAEHRSAVNTIMRATLKWQAAIGLAFCLINVVCAPLLAALMKDPSLSSYIRIAAFILPIMGFSTVFLGVMNGLRQFAGQALIFLLYSGARVIAPIGLILAGFSVKGAVIGLLVADLVRLVLAAWYCRHPGSDPMPDGKAILVFALQLVGISFFASLIMNIDLLAVKAFLGNNLQTGLYSSAVASSKIQLLLMAPISMTVIPSIAKSIAEGDRVATQRYIQLALKLVLLLILPTSILFVSANKPIIAFLFGQHFLPAAGAFNILIVGGIFLSLKAVISSIIVAAGRPLQVVAVGGTSLFLDSILLAVFIPRYGFLGAAYATGITHIVGFMALYFCMRNRCLLPAFKISFVRYGIASMVAVLLSYSYIPTGLMIIPYGAGLLLSFYGVLLLLGEISLRQLRQILGMCLWPS